MLKNPAARVAAVGALLLIAFVAYVFGTGDPHVAVAAPAVPSTTAAPGASGVDVTGTGEVAGTPDVLRLDLQVQVTRPSAPAALGATSTTMSAITRALRARHVAGKDIKTTGLSLQPNYDDSNGRSVLRGYAGAEDLAVTLRDLKTAGAAIAAATAAGGNATRIQGVALDLDSDSALLARARDAAIADARSKAEGYAKAAGRRLGEVTVVSENSTPATPFALDLATLRGPAASAASAPVPVQPGSQQVSVSVRVVWAFA